jgi:alkylhydroperoxidase family enzyme
MGDEKLVAAVLEDWRTAPVNEKVRSALGFLEKLTLCPGEVGPRDIEVMRSAGVSERAVEEAIYVCFLFNMIARLADAFDFPIPSAEGFQRDGQSLYTRGYVRGAVPG